MTTRYVDGTGAGSDAYNGLAAVYDGVNGPKATINGAEDSPVIAGDLVHVRPSTYRELLTIDVSGTAGNAIEYRGDYAGAVWPSTAGQVVRITGAANETTTGTRTNCITATSKNYRTFRGFLFDGASAQQIILTGCTDITIDQCVILPNADSGVLSAGAGQARLAISACVFFGRSSSVTAAITYSHTATVDNCAHTVVSSLITGTNRGGIRNLRVGGVTVANSTFHGIGGVAVLVSTALTVGQTVTVNNCILTNCGGGVQATTTAEFVENYNTFHNVETNRSNVTAGANSVTYPPGFDMRPYFEAFGGGTLVLPLASLASYSGLVEFSAGTGAPATDWRGHAVAGALREWGVEEYVSGYGVEAGGGVTMWPLSNGFIQAIIGGGV